jgi:hypothetical protein
MRTLLLSVLLVVPLDAADFSGTWLGELPTRANAPKLRIAQQFAIQFVQTGTTLTGKLYGDYASSPIVEGQVAGDSIDFIVVTQEQQGNQISDTRLHFTGTLAQDGSIEIKRVREGSTNAGNNGAYKANETNAPKQTFVIRHLP